jgi:RES domain
MSSFCIRQKAVGIQRFRRYPHARDEWPDPELAPHLDFEHARGPFRSFGPVDARWDHPLPDSCGSGAEQSRAILYCAPDIDTCVAEVFQATRRIERARAAAWLVVFALREPVTLLDLRGTFVTTIGASTAIRSGRRSRTRAWARELYEAYRNVQGVHYGSSMNGHAPAIALNERALAVMPPPPQFHRALNDDMLVDILQHIALRLAYGSR